jgi:hypothetical protein
LVQARHEATRIGAPILIILDNAVNDYAPSAINLDPWQALSGME